MSLSGLLLPLRAEAHAPLYLQLRDSLRSAIEQRTLVEDDILPTEQDLAQQFALSRITVRKAISGLIAEGHLARRRGVGIFVSRRGPCLLIERRSFQRDGLAVEYTLSYYRAYYRAYYRGDAYDLIAELSSGS